MKIRKALLEDAPQLAELSSQFGYPTTTLQSKDRLGILLKSNEHVVLVACNPVNKVVGWVHIFMALRLESDGFAEIGGIVVSEEYRGSGIGKDLLKASGKWAADNGVQKLRIRSRSTRSDTHAIFEHLGFEKTKEQYVFDKQIDS